MTKNPPAVLRSALYALRGGFLIRPFVIAFLIGTAGAVLSAIEERLSSDTGHRSMDAVSIACRPSGGAGHPHHDCDRHHDGRLHRFCHLVDDLDAGVHAVFAAHPHQLRPGSGHAMDARDLSRHVFLLHRGPSRGALAPFSLYAGRDCRWRHGARAGLRWLAYILHPPHFGCDQR